MTKTPDQRVITPMPDDLIQKIEDFRYSYRHPSRADAIRVLIQAGLECVGKDKSDTGAKPGRKRS
jgi:hypothetical protein